MFTSAFLLEDNLHPRHKKLLKAVKDHEATFTSLKKARNEVRSEWWNSKIQRSSASYDSLADSLTRLAQHVSGLRSGINLQRELSIKMGNLTKISMSAMREDMEVAAIQRVFGDMLDDLSPPMEALAVRVASRLMKYSAYVGRCLQATCTRALKKIRSVLIRDFKYSKREPSRPEYLLDDLITDIRRALFTFDRTSNMALARLLKRNHEEQRIDTDLSILPQEDTETLCLVYL